MIGGMLSLIALSVAPLKLLARTAMAFKATELDAVYAELFGDIEMIESSEVKMRIPDIAENGAVVPVSISTSVENVKSIHVIIEQNPNPLSASFELTDSSPADISTRVKMGKSSIVRAMVQTSDKVYMTHQEVKVTIGGCGG
jgi:sulfur-oxidizing protein SoxY